MKQIPLSKTAWVSGISITGYNLRVNLDDVDAGIFDRMDGMCFSNFRRAQDAANAIRSFVKVQRERMETAHGTST